jgi:phosphohistidine swiveling domain-containing protein
MSLETLAGAPVSGGIVSGPVRLVKDPADALAVQPGEIVVVPHSHPEYAIGLMFAGGLICESGGIICHICTVALELGIPCVTEVPRAMSLLKDAMHVTLDGSRGMIYES